MIQAPYAYENITLLDRSEMLSTKNDLATRKNIVNKTDVIELCVTERMNTRSRFYKFMDLTVIGASSKTFLMAAKTQLHPNLCLKMTQ